MSFIHAFLELYDDLGQEDRPAKWQKAAVLKCLWDGYPNEAIGFVLEDLLKEVHRRFKQSDLPDYWGSSGVGAWMVKLPGNLVAEVEGLGSVVQTFEITPAYEPGLVHGRLWRIFLGKKAGQYEIRCFRLAHDWEKKTTTLLEEEVDWRKKLEREQRR